MPYYVIRVIRNRGHFVDTSDLGFLLRATRFQDHPAHCRLSISKDAFFDLKKVRENINDSLLNYKRNLRLKASVTQPDSIFTKQMVSVELWHFMYKNVLSSQVCCSSPQKP